MRLQIYSKIKQLHTLKLYQTLLKLLQYKTHQNFPLQTTNDPQSVTDDSNVIQIPFHNKIQTNIKNPTSNNTTPSPHEGINIYIIYVKYAWNSRTSITTNNTTKLRSTSTSCTIFSSYHITKFSSTRIFKY